MNLIDILGRKYGQEIIPIVYIHSKKDMQKIERIIEINVLTIIFLVSLLTGRNCNKN
jgi:hypothetical protein